MDLRINPGKLSGTVQAPPSKSAAHRAMIIAGLRGLEIPKLDFCEDTAATYNGICSLVKAARLGKRGSCLVDCGDSGSTLRFLLPAAAALGVVTAFKGSPRLAQRPIEELVNAMEEHGARFSGANLPFVVSGSLQPGQYRVSGDISSQFVSGLIMASIAVDGDCEIELTTNLVSKGYVELTRQMLASDKLPTDVSEVEGDWSAMANFIAANALGADIKIVGLKADSLQPDRCIGEKLLQLDKEIDITDCPDLAPILAAVGLVKRQNLIFKGEGRLIHKETDRLESIKRMLNGLINGRVDCQNDHRIAMAAAIAASFLDHPVDLIGVECVSKSYPGFFKDYELLRKQSED